MNTEQLEQWLGQVDQSQSSLRSRNTENLGNFSVEGAALPQQSRFGDAVKRAAGAVHKPANAAMNAVRSFARGGEGEMHETMMAVKKGEISFKYMVALKNKAIEAYKEVMRMG